MKHLTQSQKAYREKFKDPRWQKKRLDILTRDSFSCQMCFSTENMLHVHHKFYEYGKDPWDYDDGVLTTLCDECHELESANTKKATESLNRAVKRKFNSFSIAKIAEAFEEMEMCHCEDVVLSVLVGMIKNGRLQSYLIDEYFAKCSEFTRGADSYKNREANV